MDSMARAPQPLTTASQSLSVDEARARIAAQIQPLSGFEKKGIRGSLNRILAQDIISPINVPSHTNSAMDGYALSGSDLPTQNECTLQVIGTAFAGKPYAGQVSAGQCVRIMTGAMMPAGTDTVIMQEEATREGEMIRIGNQHRQGQNVRQAGEDIAVGTSVLKRGRRITAADLGLLASLGIGEIRVCRRLRVAFFSTGDELRSIGEPLADGEIYDSNRYTLHGMLTRQGVDIIDMGVIPDLPEEIRQAFLSAAENADVVITSGGVSVGEADFIKQTLEELGEVGFWKIRMKPGRPLAFGKLGNAHFFGLPGNPVAVMVTFYQFVQPALQALMGTTEKRMRLRLPTTSAIKKSPGRTEFQRGVIHTDDKGQMTVSSTGKQGSGILHSMSHANCFIILEESREAIETGDLVTVEPFEGLI